MASPETEFEPSSPDEREPLAQIAARLRREVERERARGRQRGRGVLGRPPGASAASAAQAAAAALPAAAPGPGPSDGGLRAAPPRPRADSGPPEAPPAAPMGRPTAQNPDRRAGSVPRLAADAPSTAERARSAGSLEELAREVAGCEACGLCRTRTQTVFADGHPGARLMFVGEAPGAEEDRRGVPFVGRAGQLLSDIIAKGMGLERSSDVYIANVLKCRPPGNRDPEAGEKALCAPYLERQIELVDPQVLVPLGRHAAQYLLGVEAPLGRLRGRVHPRGERRVVPTLHPAYLLRNPAAKADCWQDIQLAMAELGLRPPER